MFGSDGAVAGGRNSVPNAGLENHPSNGLRTYRAQRRAPS